MPNGTFTEVTFAGLFRRKDWPDVVVAVRAFEMSQKKRKVVSLGLFELLPLLTFSEGSALEENSSAEKENKEPPNKRVKKSAPTPPSAELSELQKQQQLISLRIAAEERKQRLEKQDKEFQQALQQRIENIDKAPTQTRQITLGWGQAIALTTSTAGSTAKVAATLVPAATRGGSRRHGITGK